MKGELIMYNDLFTYAQEIINEIDELTEDERKVIIELAQQRKPDELKAYVVEKKTKYGYIGGKGGKF